MLPYRAVCRVLWVLGLRAWPHHYSVPVENQAREGRTLISTYTDWDIHYVNWDLLWQTRADTSPPPPWPPPLPWGGGAWWRRLLRQWLWTALVLAALLVRPAHKSLDVLQGDEKGGLAVAWLCYTWLLPVQYVQALLYLRSDHIEAHLAYLFYEKDHDVPFSESVSSSEDGAQMPATTSRRRGRWLWVITAMVLLSTLAAGLGLSIASTETLRNAGTPFSNTWVGRVVVVVDTVCGRLTQALVLCVFVIVFHHHDYDLSHIHGCLRDHVFRSVGTSVMLHHILLVKRSIDVSVRLLQPLFASFTMLGTAGTAAVLHHVASGRRLRSVPGYLLAATAAVLLAQTVLLVLAHRIAVQRQNLLELIHLPQVTMCCLSRMEGLSMLCSNEGEVRYPLGQEEQETLHNLLVISAENASTLDWTLLRQVIDQQWEEFGVLGFKVNDGAFTGKCIATVGILLSGKYLL